MNQPIEAGLIEAIQPIQPIDYSCQVCGVECSCAPQPPDRAICESCCEESEDGHDYEYCEWERQHCCMRCAKPAPPEYYDR